MKTWHWMIVWIIVAGSLTFAWSRFAKRHPLPYVIVSQAAPLLHIESGRYSNSVRDRLWLRRQFTNGRMQDFNTSNPMVYGDMVPGSHWVLESPEWEDFAAAGVRVPWWMSVWTLGVAWLFAVTFTSVAWIEGVLGDMRK